MKAWYKLADPARVISFGKTHGEPDEGFYEFAPDPQVEADNYDIEFYTITGGKLLRKPQAEIDQIIAQRQQMAMKRKLKQELEQSASDDVSLFRLIMAVYQVGISKGLWQANDFPVKIRQVAQDWGQKLNKIDT